MKRKAHFQQTLASQSGFEKYSRKSRREEFLSLMETVVPWLELEAVIEPYYPKAGNGRQPVGLSIMLRVYFLQQWFNLSDPGAEDALYESPVLRRFAGVDLGRAPAPDETTILRFRRLLGTHELCGRILDTVNHYLAGKGLRISTGTIVDATIIAVSSDLLLQERIQTLITELTEDSNPHPVTGLTPESTADDVLAAISNAVSLWAKQNDPENPCFTFPPAQHTNPGELDTVQGA